MRGPRAAPARAGRSCTRWWSSRRRPGRSHPRTRAVRCCRRCGRRRKGRNPDGTRLISGIGMRARCAQPWEDESSYSLRAAARAIDLCQCGTRAASSRCAWIAAARRRDRREDPMTAVSQTADQGQGAGAAIRRHWVLFLIQGIIMVVLGILAIGEPMVASVAVALFAGWLFLFSGIVALPGFWWGLLSALLGIVIGIYLIWRPLAGVVTLTLAIAIYFGAQGITQLITAIAQRSVLRSWGWVVFGRS